jgi:hypothetical protein
VYHRPFSKSLSSSIQFEFPGFLRAFGGEGGIRTPIGLHLCRTLSPVDVDWTPGREALHVLTSQIYRGHRVCDSGLACVVTGGADTSNQGVTLVVTPRAYAGRGKAGLSGRRDSNPRPRPWQGCAPAKVPSINGAAAPPGPVKECGRTDRSCPRDCKCNAVIGTHRIDRTAVAYFTTDGRVCRPKVPLQGITERCGPERRLCSPSGSLRPGSACPARAARRDGRRW